MINKLVRIGEAAKIMGVTPKAMREWDKSGELKPARITKGGTRYYRVSELVLAGGAVE